jgi:2-oxoglutarate ferredoxin oxidoreductase subunit beta
MSDNERKPTLPPSGKKPTLPPGMSDSTKKPSKMPPGMESKMPPGSAKLPPGMMPSGGDGDGLSRKDFESDQDIRWCPGCGDYAILATVQRLMPSLGVKKEDVVFISGIGCSSRFPYYMKTYGMHSIHGRAPSIATGLKTSRPELDVWVITGDGDSLSIGGNHLIHLLRRNVNLQLLLFNNQIYGLTKGQYSPTSEVGKITKSTPYGSLDHPFNPVALALGADGTFVARSMDRDPKHMTRMLTRGHGHAGTSMIEVYQNCNIFNDGAFFKYTEKDSKPSFAMFIENGKPLVYNNGKNGLRLDGHKIKAVDLESGQFGINDCLVYDESSRDLANIVSRIFFDPQLPQPFGVFYAEQRANYDEQLQTQIAGVTRKKGKGDLEALLHSGETWTIN